MHKDAKLWSVSDAVAKCGGMRAVTSDPKAELVKQLEAEGWVYRPKPPKPELPVVSDAASAAYVQALSAESGLRAAFKVMLRENMDRINLHRATVGVIAVCPDTLYRMLTGEDWPA